MAINWPKKRKSAAAKVLRTKERCDDVARAIWPSALKQDPSGSRRWQLWPDPDDAMYLTPKKQVGYPPWNWHVVVETESHCVDVLTMEDGSVAGVQASQYVSDHYDDPAKVDPWDGKPIITDAKGRRR